jgi:uncharacterized protein YjbI with pentapeptide repeats
MSSASRNITADLQPATAEELETVLRTHSAFVSRVAGGCRALLMWRDLSGVDLTNRVLSDADLSGAVLTRASLRFAEFVGANLYCCDMRHVDGRYANFSHADMRGAVLSGSNLSQANLNHADFRPGRLTKLGRTGRQEFVERVGTAVGVDFSHSSLCGASFEGARLRGANFSGAIIHATHFKGAHLKNAVFEGAVLSDINLDELHLSPAVLKSCILAPSPEAVSARPQQIVKLHFHQRWVNSDALEGKCAVFDGEDLRPIGDVIGKYKLTAMSAKRAIAVAMDFSGTELQGANFEEADLRGANFESTDLRGVRFRGARLDHAKFMGADMRALLLRSGEKLECDLFGAKVTDEQLAEAIRS